MQSLQTMLFLAARRSFPNAAWSIDNLAKFMEPRKPRGQRSHRGWVARFRIVKILATGPDAARRSDIFGTNGGACPRFAVKSLITRTKSARADRCSFTTRPEIRHPILGKTPFPNCIRIAPEAK